MDIVLEGPSLLILEAIAVPLIINIREEFGFAILMTIFKDEQDLDFVSLRLKVHIQSLDELDRDFAEITNDITFLESQVECDLGSYTSEQLAAFYKRISRMKKKAEILKAERATRECN